MTLVKAVLTSTSLATGFEGGPVFPLLFIGGTLGLALSKILPFIPQGVGVTAGMAGVACAAFPLPLTITLLLGLMGGQIDLLPVIAIGAVTGFIVSKALTPLLPKRGMQDFRWCTMINPHTCMPKECIFIGMIDGEGKGENTRFS